MIAVSSVKLRILGALTAGLLLVALAGAIPAYAEAPWWHLSSSSAPTNLPAPVSQVDELRVTATGGSYLLSISAPTLSGSKSSGSIAYEAEASVVQASLEAALGTGTGTVTVSGGPGDATGSKPYVISFQGALAGQPVTVTVGSDLLSGTPHGIAVTQVTEGAASGLIRVVATNLGDEAINGAASPVTVTDKLPSGLQAIAISGKGTDGPVGCVLASLTCTWAGPEPLAPYHSLEVTLTVETQPHAAAAGEESEATVAGGGLPEASVKRPVVVNGEPTPFGIENYELSAENEGGLPDTQAGSHPFQLTATFAVNEATERFVLIGGTTKVEPIPAVLAKDLRFKLPPGLVGNATALPQCTELEFVTYEFAAGNLCPADTAVGVATVTINEPENAHLETVSVPLFNMVPSPGEPARFGFEVLQASVILDTSVRTGEDYGVTVSVSNITELAGFLSSQLTFWGVPGDARHDQSRGWKCLHGGSGCVPAGQEHPAAFLTLPTSCTGPLQSTVEADSWAEPFAPIDAQYAFPDQLGQPVGLGGCNQLAFDPSIEVVPDGNAGSTPTGLTVDVHVPQETSATSNGVAEADVKSTTVTLPAGVQLSPSGANGLEACSNAQIGFTGENSQTKTDEFTDAAPSCPKGSKIATVKIKTPLLANPLEGAVYLAAPQNFAGLPQNPFGSLIAMYIVAEDPVSGTLVKLPGKVSPNPVTGQLVTTFENTPQLPFEELELHFFGGERAPLSTPASCGSFTTQASFAPWSGYAAAEPSSSFEITSGPNGAPCPGPRPFSPGFDAQTTNIQAGAFTPFALTMTRPDADQALGRIEMQLPPGFSGDLSNVKLCGEPQASLGTCGPESEIGETVVSAGLGSDPYTVTGGKVYITTAYGGGNYGLSIVNPAAAGPFVLDEGRPVVVRAAIFVDPHTAALRVLSEPLPTILDGIPLQLQHVYVNINRPDFTFNPTNCKPMGITGTISSNEGASAAVSTPFQVTNCATLKFEPKFAVSTSGKTSKADGASLNVKLTYPNTPQGAEANIAKVKVDLPKQLPSRLTTLQKACVAKVFEANPASCPAASVVGHAKAITPILPVPLEGPAYFVSHGGEAFPSLIFVLQGYGVTEDLVATTFISKAGITSSTLKAVPDVPVGSFELNLPEKKYSALAANGNLCKSKLAMPTAFVGQNGAEIHTSTPISVTGCKPALGIVRHSVKGTKATIVVSVPSAGKLLATGKGVSAGRGKAGKAGDVSVKVTLTKAEQAFLKKYPRRKLKAKINLRFTPRKGAKLTTSVTVLIA